MTQSIHEALARTNQPNILLLLEKAKVETGYLFGRRIFIPGLEGSVTFTELAQRLNELYEQNIAVARLTMEIEFHIRAPHYQPKNKADEYLRRQRAGEPLDPIHYAKFEDQVNWKRKVDAKLEALFETSQNKLDEQAEKDWIVGKVARAWDALLNRLSQWRVDNSKDIALYNWALDPNSDSKEEEVIEDIEHLISELQEKEAS